MTGDIDEPLNSRIVLHTEMAMTGGDDEMASTSSDIEQVSTVR